jgi:hypothetical protein
MIDIKYATMSKYWTYYFFIPRNEFKFGESVKSDPYLFICIVDHNTSSIFDYPYLQRNKV